jgi:hypothetical protein
MTPQAMIDLFQKRDLDTTMAVQVLVAAALKAPTPNCFPDLLQRGSEKTHPHIRFERYADDIICHCRRQLLRSAIATKRQSTVLHTVGTGQRYRDVIVGWFHSPPTLPAHYKIFLGATWITSDIVGDGAQEYYP